MAAPRLSRPFLAPRLFGPFLPPSRSRASARIDVFVTLPQVVKNVVELPHSWGIPPTVAHGYIVNSNNIQRFAEVPSVRINYDIMPIIVHVKSKFITFYAFLTRLCAILGGVFTITGIVTAVVDAGVTSMLKKDRLGKLG